VASFVTVAKSSLKENRLSKWRGGFWQLQGLLDGGFLEQENEELLVVLRPSQSRKYGEDILFENSVRSIFTGSVWWKHVCALQV
jgi:hypothetical protein